MHFDEYMLATRETALYPKVLFAEGGGQHPAGLYYVALGLGEVGEIQNKIKKIIRDKEGYLSKESANDIAKEAGDALWYLARLCDELSMSFDDIAAMNLEKLRSRKERGVLKGSGDDR